jgi:hypothetical protein
MSSSEADDTQPEDAAEEAEEAGQMVTIITHTITSTPDSDGDYGIPTVETSVISGPIEDVEEEMEDNGDD